MMSDECKYLSNEFLEQFIHLYKSHPSLWKMKSNIYISKYHKSAAYDDLVNFCRTVYPEADREFVARKIQSMRGSFRREVKKVRHSERTATSPSRVYKPSLWYYDHLSFLLDHECQNESISCTDGIEGYEGTEGDLDDMKPELISEKSFEEDIKPDLKVFQESWNLSQNSPIDQANKKRKEEFEGDGGYSAHSDSSYPAATSNFRERPSDDSKEFDAVGLNVAAKLKKMASSQQIYAELLINKVLAKGLLNKLTEETDLSEF